MHIPLKKLIWEEFSCRLLQNLASSTLSLVKEHSKSQNLFFLCSSQDFLRTLFYWNNILVWLQFISMIRFCRLKLASVLRLCGNCLHCLECSSPRSDSLPLVTHAQPKCYLLREGLCWPPHQKKPPPNLTMSPSSLTNHPPLLSE